MATESRTQDTALVPATSPSTEEPMRAWILSEMEREPWRFEFFQAVRLLQLAFQKRDPVGRFSNSVKEAVRFGAHAATAFPASQIQSLTFDREGPALMRLNFMGLTGPVGVLPACFTELVIERTRGRDRALAEFLDLFNHRMTSFFYAAWEKHQFAIAAESGRDNRFSEHLLDILGLGIPGLKNRQEIPDDALLFYTGLLAMHTRPAVGLEQLLSDYFNIEVAVEQFVGAWYRIEPDSQCSLGTGVSYAERLGLGSVVGDEVWNQQSRVRVRLGPLRMEDYVGFLPGGKADGLLRSLLRLYSGLECDVEIQLVLDRRDVPRCELLAQDGDGVQLGWTTWMNSGALQRDPADTTLELDE